MIIGASSHPCRRFLVWRAMRKDKLQLFFLHMTMRRRYIKTLLKAGVYLRYINKKQFV